MTDLFEPAAPTTRTPGKPIPSWTPPELPPRRSRRRPLIALAVAVVLLGGLAVGLWLPGRITQSNTSAQTQSKQQQPQPQPQQPGPAVVSPPVEPPASAADVTPPAKPAPTDRRAPAAAAPAPAAQQPAPAPPPAPPKVEGQLVSPYPMHKAGCDGDRAGVIATVSSDGEPRAVTLSSRGPGEAGRTVAMTKVGNGWVAALGPYGAVGNATWKVEVTDAHGVTASGPESTLPVVAC